MKRICKHIQNSKDYPALKKILKQLDKSVEGLYVEDKFELIREQWKKDQLSGIPTLAYMIKLSEYLSQLGFYQQANTFLSTVLQISSKLDYKTLSIQIFLEVANNCSALGDYESSNINYSIVLQLYAKINARPEQIAVVLQLMGDNYYQKEKYISALEFFAKAEQMALHVGNDYKLGIACKLKAVDTYFEILKDYKSAQKKLQQIINLERKQKSTTAQKMVLYLIYLARVYNKMENYKDCLKILLELDFHTLERKVTQSEIMDILVEISNNHQLPRWIYRQALQVFDKLKVTNRDIGLIIQIRRSLTMMSNWVAAA